MSSESVQRFFFLRETTFKSVAVIYNWWKQNLLAGNQVLIPIKYSCWVALNWNFCGLRFWCQEHDTVLRWSELLLFKLCQTLGSSVLCLECNAYISEWVTNSAVELKSLRVKLWPSGSVLLGDRLIIFSIILRKYSYTALRSWTENNPVLWWAAWLYCNKCELLLGSLHLALLHLVNSPFIIFSLKVTWSFSTLCFLITREFVYHKEKQH